ncbi:hypothetical protein AVEN_113961-1 [Araneus ventricosus]|uniref:Uncharacterized protein n=1 Tax=Araneus ventricosus TaxID=182803 RepID=A0A4Y2WJ42_ARAVE|nr:hypothetical protein AVEN_113961-1 [Araneus ventricosus]
MLHHVILEEPRSWHTKIPFVLWAYREVPNSTTGVAPFQLLYGRKPEGPLTILKKHIDGRTSKFTIGHNSCGSLHREIKETEDAAEKAKLISTRENGSSLQFEIYEENL